MVTSALVGQMPANQHDRFIVEGFWRDVLKTYGPGGPPNPPLIPVKMPPGASHHSRQGQIYAEMSVVIFIIISITGTRLMLRLCRKELRWGSDDWAIAIAAAMSISFCAFTINAAQSAGAGRHMYDTTYAELEKFVTGLSIGPILFYLSVGMIKVSICLFNRRLTGLTSQRWMIYHYTLLVCLVIFMLSVVFGYVFMCIPVWPMFRLSDLGARTYKTKCSNGTNMTVAFSVLHAIFDFFLLPVPLIVMKRVRMTRSQRIRLSILFSIGALSFIGAVMRTTVLRTHQVDVTYQFPDFNRWSIIDLVFAIAVASLPTLNAVLPKKWRNNSPSGGSPKFSDPAKPHGEAALVSKDSETQVQVVKLEDGHSSGSDSRTDSAAHAANAAKGDAKQPKWDDFHPELKVGV